MFYAKTVDKDHLLKVLVFRLGILQAIILPIAFEQTHSTRLNQVLISSRLIRREILP